MSETTRAERLIDAAKGAARMDMRDNESYGEYAERKDRELMEKVRDGKSTTRELARAMADAVDANILAKYEASVIDAPERHR